MKAKIICCIQILNYNLGFFSSSGCHHRRRQWLKWHTLSSIETARFQWILNVYECNANIHWVFACITMINCNHKTHFFGVSSSIYSIISHFSDFVFLFIYIVCFQFQFQFDAVLLAASCSQLVHHRTLPSDLLPILLWLRLNIKLEKLVWFIIMSYEKTIHSVDLCVARALLIARAHSHSYSTHSIPTEEESH